MSPKTKYITSVLIGFTAISFLMAYFVKPHRFTAEIVAPEPTVSKVQTVAVRTLADRVAMSYNLAFVIVKSEFSEKNANALESLRNWAKRNFQHDPHFLHPASIEQPSESNQSIIDSFSYTIFATIRYYLAQPLADFLSWRISDFHATEPYRSFSADYYDVFGQDSEATALLARYQSQRARDAIDPLIAMLFWLILSGAVLFNYYRGKIDSHASKEQRALASIWTALSMFYVASGWIQNQVPILISAIICGAIGIYLWRPVKLTYGENNKLDFELIRLNRLSIVLMFWVTVSMLLIRIVSWINTGSLLTPDPVSLIISAFTGDFLHDPAEIKRNVDRLIGVVWAFFSIWTLLQIADEPEDLFEQEEDLTPIQKSYF